MARKNALRLRYRKLFASAGLVTLQSEPVPDDQIWCIQRAAWEIDKATSGGNTRCRRYIDGHGYKHYLSEEDAPTANALYWDADPVWLTPGEMMSLDIDEAQADTVALMSLTGYFTPIGEGVV